MSAPHSPSRHDLLYHQREFVSTDPLLTISSQGSAHLQKLYSSLMDQILFQYLEFNFLDQLHFKIRMEDNRTVVHKALLQWTTNQLPHRIFSRIKFMGPCIVEFPLLKT